MGWSHITTSPALSLSPDDSPRASGLVMGLAPRRFSANQHDLRTAVLVLREEDRSRQNCLDTLHFVRSSCVLLGRLWSRLVKYKLKSIPSTSPGSALFPLSESTSRIANSLSVAQHARWLLHNVFNVNLHGTNFPSCSCSNAPPMANN